MEVRCNKSAKRMKLAPSSSSCFITNLPTPILMEILCRLPIKTLTVSKSVCKSWLLLSRDPHFTQLYQARAPTEVCFQLWHDKDETKLHMGNFHCLNYFDPLDVKVHTLFELPKFNLIFSNSCNGLLCYSGGYLNSFTVVWNPCTSEFITLPARSNRCYYGLGFSKKINKYKLLQVFSRTIRESLGKNPVAEICTIEKGCSWNTLGPCPSYVGEVIESCSRSYKDPTFLHCTLHWPSCRNDSDADILTFDFEDDRFGSVPLPPSFDKTNILLCRVGELLGCLFVTEWTDEGINIWLMKEYGVRDSWTKMYSLPCIDKGKRLNQNGFLAVTCMDNGLILFAHNKDISTGVLLDHRGQYEYISTCVFSYNLDAEGFRCIGSGRGPFRVIPYRPSLVSLKDSMLGYEVHVSALKHRQRSTTPDWWTLYINCRKRKRHDMATSESSTLPNESGRMEDAMKQIKTIRAEVMEKQRNERHVQLQEFEEKKRNEFVKIVAAPFKEQIEQLKKHNEHLEERLQDAKAKVKRMKRRCNKVSNSNNKTDKLGRGGKIKNANV